MSELAELASRLERVETDLASLKAEVRTIGRAASATDSDVSSLQEQRRGDVRLIQALRTTQLEHSATLKEHSKLLGLLVTTQEEQGGILRHHGSVLNQHTEVLNQHTEVLNGHTEVLNGHTEVLNGHTAALARIERHLGIG